MPAEAPEPAAAHTLAAPPPDLEPLAHTPPGTAPPEAPLVWAQPAVPDDSAGTTSQPGYPGEARGAGSVPDLDDILDALADQLELALLRAYGTSGG
jgi:hypothetical protein